MAIEEAKVVDAIGIDKSTGHVNLSVFDAMDWTDTLKHLYLLQEKLNSYLSFVESGEVYTSYPEAAEREFEFNIVFKYTPPREATKVLNAFRNIIINAGISFAWEVFRS